MPTNPKRKFIFWAFVGFACWVLGFYLAHSINQSTLNPDNVADFQEQYQAEIKSLSRANNAFVDGISQQETVEELFNYALRSEEQGEYDYFIFHEDSMIAWSTNTLSFEADDLKDGNQVYFLENGWRQITWREKDTLICATSFLIKDQYPYENEDLINTFDSRFDIHFAANLVPAKKDGIPVKTVDGETAFNLVSVENPEPNKGLEIIIFFLYIFSFIILLQLLISAMQKLLLKRPLTLIIVPIIIVGVRYLWLKLEWKFFFDGFKLFDPELFASSELTPSLGDLIINVVIFYFLVHFLLKRTRSWFKQGRKKLKLGVFLLPLYILSFYVAFSLNNIIYSLVYDSTISFDLERLFDLSIYSFISLALVGASFYAYFRLIQYIILQIKKTGFEWNKLAFIFVITSFAYVIIDQFYFENNLLSSFWPVFLNITLLWFEYKERQYKFVHIISILAFISFYAAFILRGYTEQNEKELRVNLTEKLAKDRDPLTELDYDDIERKIIRDKIIVPFFLTKDFNHSIFSEEIEKVYFEQLKPDYDLKFYLFDSNEKLVVDYRNFNIKDYNSLSGIINESGIASDKNDHIYYVKDYTEKLVYISKLPIIEKDSLFGYLFTEFRSKKFPEDIGLPSLLLDSRTTTFDQLKNYSLAKYVDDQLVNKKGEYNFPTEADIWPTHIGGFVNKDGYSHYVHEEEPGALTVLSLKLSPTLSWFTAFSYLLILYGVLLLIPLAYRQFQTKISFKNIKFNVKIQAVLIGLTLITLLAFAIGSASNLTNQEIESNKGLIEEKIGSVKTELEQKLKKEGQLNTGVSDYLEYLLKKFSNVFLTDINLFDPSGNLLASSQPKIYSQGLISDYMNAKAFQAMVINHKSKFVHEEHIGKLNYLSAYTPFYNQKGEFLAFLNVQYISRQDELENQISSYILSIVNIMVLMLAFSTILSIFVSNRLTRPLKYIQDSLRTVQLGSVAQPIDYDGNDEIGELVKEYNSKLLELQKNAEQLAKSERESAWREMAKQVAHEIKNPLTPMKLSIQHLQRSVNMADDDSKEKLAKVSRSLIEQIDALTTIANEFSNFAKMPKAQEEEMNLVAVAQSAVAVFGEVDDHELTLVSEVGDEALVWADKDLLLRVFNNLIKNAIQAIPVGEEGRIKVIIDEKGNNFVVTVKDNGVGITDEQKEKLFVPYFTTKSTGTGLGLAMCKQIVENMNGEIGFESTFGMGTSFFVEFPKLNA